MGQRPQLRALLLKIEEKHGTAFYYLNPATSCQKADVRRQSPQERKLSPTPGSWICLQMLLVLALRKGHKAMSIWQGLAAAHYIPG